jgi:hypothetical protein
MIDPTFVDITDIEVATISPYPPTMEELEQKVARISNELTHLTNDRDYWQARALNYSNKILALETYIKDNFDYLDADVVRELTEMFDLAIMKEYDVEVTVRFTGTIEAPLGFDMDELENNLEAHLNVSHYADSMSGEFSEDSVEIDYREL